MLLSTNALLHLKMNKFISCSYKLLTGVLCSFALSSCSHLDNLSQQSLNSMGYDQYSPAVPVLVNVVKVIPLKESSSTITDEKINSDTDFKASDKNSGRAQEFQVIFEYKGQTYSTQLPFDPGANLLIQASAPLLQGEPANFINSPGSPIYSNNEVYVVAPSLINPYPTSFNGFFIGFPVFYNGGYYQRLPGRFYLNRGNHKPFTGSRGKGRK